MGQAQKNTSRREKSTRWRFHWIILSVIAVSLALYNAAANIWLLTPQTCRAYTASPPSVSEVPITCEVCTETPNSNIFSDDDPLSRLDIRLGRWDNSRAYKIYDNAAVGEMYPELSSSRRVSLATQSSIERLHEILKITDHWSGPISVAVFVAGDEFRLLRGFATWLYKCRQDIYARVTLHVLTPVKRLAQTSGATPPWARDCSKKPQLPGERRADTVAWRIRNAYPQNHLRNVARKNCHTPYVFLVDIDIVPSKGMAETLETFFGSKLNCSMCAYVIPTYELDRRVVNFPENKTELVRLSRNKLAIPFHYKVFIYNQFASNFSRWEASGGNESELAHVSHNVTNFELFYEPFYVAADTVPSHDEQFIGYGFTRNTQVYEMFLVGYQFKVLSPVFTIHWGLQGRRTRPMWRERQNDRNRKHFETFKRELFARYRKDPFHLLKKPVQAKKV